LISTGKPADPSNLISAIDMLYIGDAEKWIDSTLRVYKLLSRKREAIKKDVTELKEMLEERFPSEVADIIENSVQDDIENLEQEDSKSLASYYKYI
jgi:hypothetical protein